MQNLRKKGKRTVLLVCIVACLVLGLSPMEFSDINSQNEIELESEYLVDTFEPEIKSSSNLNEGTWEILNTVKLGRINRYGSCDVDLDDIPEIVTVTDDQDGGFPRSGGPATTKILEYDSGSLNFSTELLSFSSDYPNYLFPWNPFNNNSIYFLNSCINKNATWVEYESGSLTSVSDTMVGLADSIDSGEAYDFDFDTNNDLCMNFGVDFGSWRHSELNASGHIDFNDTVYTGNGVGLFIENMDDDQGMELVVASSDGDVTVYDYNNQTGSFTQNFTVDVGHEPACIYDWDYDLNGIPNLMVISRETTGSNITLTAYEFNSGTSTYELGAESFTTDLVYSGLSMQPALDIFGDGDREYVFNAYNGSEREFGYITYDRNLAQFSYHKIYSNPVNALYLPIDIDDDPAYEFVFSYENASDSNQVWSEIVDFQPSVNLNYHIENFDTDVFTGGSGVWKWSRNESISVNTNNGYLINTNDGNSDDWARIEVPNTSRVIEMRSRLNSSGFNYKLPSLHLLDSANNTIYFEDYAYSGSDSGSEGWNYGNGFTQNVKGPFHEEVWWDTRLIITESNVTLYGKAPYRNSWDWIGAKSYSGEIKYLDIRPPFDAPIEVDFLKVWYIGLALPPPTLLSPIDDTHTNTYNPFLEWESIEGAVEYQLQLDDDSGFSSPVTYTTSNVNHTLPPLTDDTYHWRVRAKNTTDAWGDYSSYFTFTVDTLAPLAPNLIYPSIGGTIAEISPNLDWDPVVDAVEYILYFADNSGFIDCSSYLTSDTNYTLPTQIQGTYYWQVSARDRAENWGFNSSYRDFTIDTTGPDSPILSTPTNAFVTNNNTPNFEWTIPVGATGYHIQIATDSGFTTLIVNDTTATNSYISPLLSDDVYYWHVRAKNIADNWGDFSSDFSFTVDTVGPSAPNLVYPANTDLINDNTPEMLWDSVTDAILYRIYVADNPSFTSTSNYDTGTSGYILSALSDDTYYWRVSARDLAGNWGVNSTTYSFTVDTIPPPVVTLNSPLDGATIVDNTPYFDWEMSSGAVRYRIEISIDSDFSTSVVNDTTVDIFYQVLSTLSNGLYYWRITARDDAFNWGASSVGNSFTILRIGPDPPILLSPSDSYSTNHNTTLLNWTDITDVVEYQILVSTSSGFSSPIINVTTSDSHYTTTPLSDGTYYWKVRVRNSTLIWSDYSTYWEFTIDQTAPIILISDPLADFVLQSGVEIIWDIQDTSTNLIIKYSWNSELYDQTFTGSNYPITPSGDTNHTLYIFAEDDVGNNATAEFEFTIDDTPPTATFGDFVNYKVVSGLETIRVTPDDANGIAKVEFYVNDQLIEAITTGYLFEWYTESYPDGQYEVKFVVEDNAGNTYTRTFTITVDNPEEKEKWYEKEWLWAIIGILVTIILALIGWLIFKK